MRFFSRGNAVIAALVGAILLVSFFIERYGIFMPMKQAMQTRSISTGVLNYGTMGKVLKQLGLFRVEKNDYKRFKKTGESSENIELITFQKKRYVDEFVFTVNQLGKSGFRSSALAQSIKQKKDWPILSIAVAESDLYHNEHGIVANREKKGKEWERIAEISYIKDGKVVFATNAGIRVHGGARLKTKKYKNGFKIYFRNKYGLKYAPEREIFSDLSIPLKTLVVQTTSWPTGYPINNPLAYDIARQSGCVVPGTQLVEIYLNGKRYSMGYIVEHLSRRQWGQRFGHDNFSFYKYRHDNTPEDIVMHLEKVDSNLGKAQKLDAALKTQIDLDNLSRYLFSWVFCGTTDYCQGVAAYDFSSKENKLFWINWDMDHSFYDYTAKTNRYKRENWQQAAFNLIYNKKSDCVQTLLFNKLIKENTEYRHTFFALITEVLNHKLTQSFLRERVRYYKRMLAQYGEPHAEYIKILEDFVERRPEFVLRDMKNLFSLDGPYLCEVVIPDNSSALIDGYLYTKHYAGKYFRGFPITVSLPAEINERLDYWLVNGEKVESQAVSLELHEDTKISYVLK